MAGDDQGGAREIADGPGDGGTHRGDVELGSGVKRQARAEECRGAWGKERDKDRTGGVEEREGLSRQGLRLLNVYYCNIHTNSRIIQHFQDIVMRIYTA